MNGSLSDIPLGFDDANVICGAGFALVKPSPIDWDFTTSAGVRVVLRKDAASVVAHLPNAQAKPEDILEAGHDAAQEALPSVPSRSSRRPYPPQVTRPASWRSVASAGRWRIVEVGARRPTPPSRPRTGWRQGSRRRTR
jgi:hypothetical protein